MISNIFATALIVFIASTIAARINSDPLDLDRLFGRVRTSQAIIGFLFLASIVVMVVSGLFWVWS